jgi:hypothetical protein
MYEQDDDDGSDRAFLKEGKDLSGKNSVRRPPVQPFDPQKDDFIFMQIDTDYYTEVPPSKPVNPYLLYHQLYFI